MWVISEGDWRPFDGGPEDADCTPSADVVWLCGTCGRMERELGGGRRVEKEVSAIVVGAEPLYIRECGSDAVEGDLFIGAFGGRQRAPRNFRSTCVGGRRFGQLGHFACTRSNDACGHMLCYSGSE